MAELWKLPIIFVIENNQYAMGTSVNRSSAEDQLYRRGESFRIPGIQVDGMDVLAVRGAAETAVEWVRARQGAGPAGAQDLPLSRPLDVRSGQISHARGSAGGAREVRPDRGASSASSKRWASSEDELKAIDKRDHARSSSRRPISPSSRPSPSRPSSTPTCWWRATDGDRTQDARAFPDDGGGHARQVAGEGRRHGRVRRHPRRDRDRQGDDGVRGGRRGHDRARSWSPRAPTT